MARSHGKIHASIWRDPDWRALTGDAQRLYLLILSQPKLSLCGVIDHAPERWSATCSDWTLDRLSDALGELEDARYVLRDTDTGELAVRTFIRHDFDAGRWNRNLSKGVWSAWEAVESDELRHEIVHEMPVDIWDRLAEHAPASAEQIRRSNRTSPSRPNGPSERSVRTPVTVTPAVTPAAAAGPSEPEPTPPEPSPDPPPAAAAVDEIPPPLSDRERTQRFHEAVEILVRRTIVRRPANSNPTGYERSLRRGKRADHAERAMDFLSAWPDVDAEGLADFLEPPAAGGGTDESVQRQRAFDLLSNPRCSRCSGTTWLAATLNDDGSWGPVEPCPDCNPEARTA